MSSLLYIFFFSYSTYFLYKTIFGSIENIYSYCQMLMENGVTILRPPRDGHMAFIRTPDQISIEFLQEGDKLPIQEPWASMENQGSW